MCERVQQLMLVTMLAVAASQCARAPQPAACVVRFTIPPPPDTQFSPQQIPALSPDGSRVALTAAGPDRITRLWVQSLRRSVVTPVSGTDGATFPFWSPDGESLGFFAEGRLKRVGLSSGEPQVLADALDGRGGSWSAKGVIIFSAASGHAIFSIPSTGGAVRQVTNLENEPDGEDSWPTFLPDSEHFVYSSIDEVNTPHIFLGSLRSSEKDKLLNGTYSPVASSGPGFLLFAGDDVLLRVRFDLKLFEVIDPPILVAQGVRRGPSGMAWFSASADGSAVVYGRAGTEMVWLDAAGREATAAPDPGAYRHPSISPSGQDILVSVGGPWLATGAAIYYVYETKTDQWRRVAEGMSSIRRPLWAADGSEVIFTADDGAMTQIRAVRADGSGAGRKLFDESRGAYAAAISPKGGLMAIVEPPNAARTDLNLRVVSLSGGGGLEASSVWQRRTAVDQYPAFSPDGRWLAYVSNESGLDEVYVSELVAPAAAWRVSAHEGGRPVWSRDGKQLFYENRSGIVAATTEGSPSTWGARERVLFRTEDLRGRLYEMDEFDVSRDGTRFLMLKRPDPDRPAQLMGLVACGGSSIPMIFP